MGSPVLTVVGSGVVWSHRYPPGHSSKDTWTQSQSHYKSISSERTLAGGSPVTAVSPPTILATEHVPGYLRLWSRRPTLEANPELNSLIRNKKTSPYPT